jgi:hypothetical protein
MIRWQTTRTKSCKAASSRESPLVVHYLPSCIDIVNRINTIKPNLFIYAYAELMMLQYVYVYCLISMTRVFPHQAFPLHDSHTKIMNG